MLLDFLIEVLHHSSTPYRSGTSRPRTLNRLPIAAQLLATSRRDPPPFESKALEQKKKSSHPPGRLPSSTEIMC